MSKPIRREPEMPRAEFEALQESLHAAAKLMSREQIIELADALFDHSRLRRELRSWRPRSMQL